MHYLLMSRSLTSAQKTARRLQSAGIFASVAKAPQSANPGGCAYGVKIGLRSLSAALRRLDADGIPVLRVLRVSDSGEAVEVAR